MEQNKTQQAIRSLIGLGCTVEDIMEAASKIGEEQNQQPTDRLHDTSIDITERIKTFDDAVAYLGEDCKLVQEYRATSIGLKDNKDIVAYTKLRIIAAALNEEPEGWRPTYPDNNGHGGDYRWAPYFRAVFVGGSAVIGACAGLASANPSSACSAAAAFYGSRLCYKSEELAQYSGQQFTDIWTELIMR